MFGKLSIFNRKRRDEGDGPEGGSEYRYCPDCGDEYRADISCCVSCGLTLITGAQMREQAARRDGRKMGRSLKITADDELVTLKSGSLLDMKGLQRLLEKEVIGSLLVGEGAECRQGCCGAPTVRLQVKAADSGAALQVLAREFRRSTALDSHEFGTEVEAVFDEQASSLHCPACGSDFVPTQRSCPHCGLCF